MSASVFIACSAKTTAWVERSFSLKLNVARLSFVSRDHVACAGDPLPFFAAVPPSPNALPPVNQDTFKTTDG